MNRAMAFLGGSLAAWLLSIATAKAEEVKITGAFGYTLGAQMDPKQIIGKAQLTSGTPMYQFAPDKRFRSFSKYYVLVTPKTHVIYEIWGVGQVDNVAAGQKEQSFVMSLLQEKYGSKEKEGLLDVMSDSKAIHQGNRYVMTKLTGFMDVTIEIRYCDSDLETLAEQERIELEKGKTDASGL